MITSRIEDYLETIFEIEMEGKLPSITELAARLKLRKATVTVAVQRMTEEGLLLHERYGKVALSRKGLELALKTYRRHQQMTFLFRSILDIAPEVAETMACAVEHDITPEADQRLAAFTEFYTAQKKADAPWLTELATALKKPQMLTVPLAMVPLNVSSMIHSINLPPERQEELKDLGIAVDTTVTRCGEDHELRVFVNNKNEAENLPLIDGVAIWVIPCHTGQN